jgi:hypothetical protein
MSSEANIRPGGLMRCCLDRTDWPENPRVGDLLTCPHRCSSQLVYYNGAWEWYKPGHPLRVLDEPGPEQAEREIAEIMDQAALLPETEEE